MSPPTNLLGALIFWLYILLALFFTTLVLHTIIRQTSTPPALQSHVAIFSFLAVASFATLSFNMLHVLIQSYILWSAQTDTIGLLREPISLAKVWTWSSCSTLFRDFGEAIVADERRYAWVQWELLGTLSVCLYMGAEGIRRQVPRLWAFFALSQILPISFAQNLFYVAALRSPAAFGLDASMSRNISLRAIAAYCICLAIAPYAAGGPYLISAILFARAMLFVPLVLARKMSQRAGEKQAGRTFFTHQLAQQAVVLFAVALTAKQAYLLYQSKSTARETWKALFSHPAVTALGVDFLLSALGHVAWTLSQNRIRNSALEREKAS
ncbi:hypothetical protein DOTSEDRAFT_56931 [Dothistroma septosporum NZE10]|uniref:Uncharacterized protein n=1 Tax=Dothistroma septosporum (strain NZE10 / CBS 128990) TaxID=675120 RepID=M2XJG4_DOTSN|nr:hypothetical protein DOTSEDRAFT_56931 [Dothistroma septosporum NZE10]